MTEYIFDEDSNINLDLKRSFCFDLLGFLKEEQNITFDRYFFVFDQMRKGLCPYKSKCLRYQHKLPKKKSRFYLTPQISLIPIEKTHYYIKRFESLYQFQTKLF